MTVRHTLNPDRKVTMIPALFLLAMVQTAPSLKPVEIRPRLFVLPGSPDAATLVSIKSLGITHVINLRHLTEGDFRPEGTAVRSGGGTYLSCPLDREPTATGLDSFRAQMSALPPAAKVLVHCATGNRAGGALFAYWVLDQGMPEAEALALARKAGLGNPATEAAVKAYVAAQQRRQEHSPLSPDGSK